MKTTTPPSGGDPFDQRAALHNQIWKTQGLKPALHMYGFDGTPLIYDPDLATAVFGVCAAA